jgi:hypothetical protein
MRFYVASGYGNKDNVLKFIKVLEDAGHECTFNWPLLGSVDEKESTKLLERIQELAEVELEAVISAEIFIAVLPGGVGTHTELGMALGSGCKNIVICAEKEEEHFDIYGRTNVHYFKRGTSRRLTGNFESWVVEVLGIMENS